MPRPSRSEIPSPKTRTSPWRGRVLQLAAALGLLPTGLFAQTIGDIRDAVREAANSGRYASFVAALVDLTDDTELSSAQLTIDGPPELELGVTKLPYRSKFDLTDLSPDLYVEANLGYLSGRARFDDLWSGSAPGLETRVDSKWKALSGFAAVGLEFPVLTDGLSVTPLLNTSLSYVENDADFSGPGAELTQAVTDGILFNWNATLAAFGSAVRVAFDGDVSDSVRIESVARYDLRWVETIDSTDSAQDASTSIQRLTLRADLIGDTGWTAFDHGIDWRTICGYTRFLDRTGDDLGFDEYFELGLGLETALDGELGPLSRLSMSGSILFGDELSGWTIGGGVAF